MTSKKNVLKVGGKKAMVKPLGNKGLMVKVAKWLKTHTKAELAYKLGLQTTSTVDVWLKKGMVPGSRVQMVKDVLGGRKVVV